MVLKEKDIIKEVNVKYQALIMNRLWRIDLYAVTISMDNSNPLNIISFMILRVQFQIFCGLIWN